VIIQLARFRFPATIDQSAIEITEAKHNQLLNSLMEWKVDSTRKRLTIRFRPGMGDFGTGNRIQVRVMPRGLEPPSTGPLMWVIGTDPI
jgi:hypothetical protein